MTSDKPMNADCQNLTQRLFNTSWLAMCFSIECILISYHYHCWHFRVSELEQYPIAMGQATLVKNFDLANTTSEMLISLQLQAVSLHIATDNIMLNTRLPS